MEFKLGTFKYAIDPGIKNFRQFPSFFKKLNKNKKNCNVLYWWYPM